jgi:hypothetical protein
MSAMAFFFVVKPNDVRQREVAGRLLRYGQP